MSKLFSSVLLGVILLTASCKKGGFNPLTINNPETPVTVSNVYGMFNFPAVAASVKDSVITIQLNIPAGSSRNIKEISRVVYSNATTATVTLLADASKVTNTANVGIYVKNPIAGNGKSVTFQSSFPEYRTITSQTIPLVSATSALLNRYFHFLITLDDGSKIIPMPVRVIVVQ